MAFLFSNFHRIINFFILSLLPFNSCSYLHICYLLLYLSITEDADTENKKRDESNDDYTMNKKILFLKQMFKLFFFYYWANFHVTEDTDKEKKKRRYKSNDNNTMILFLKQMFRCVCFFYCIHWFRSWIFPLEVSLVEKLVLSTLPPVVDSVLHQLQGQ